MGVPVQWGPMSRSREPGQVGTLYSHMALGKAGAEAWGGHGSGRL